MFSMDVFTWMFYVGVFGRADPAPTVDVTPHEHENGRTHRSAPTVYGTNNKKNVRASHVGAPDNIHPLTVGAGSACPEHTHKNKNEYDNRRGRPMCLPEYTHIMILK